MKNTAIMALFLFILSCGTNEGQTKEKDSAQTEVIEQINSIEEEAQNLENEIEEVDMKVEELNQELDELLKDI